MKTLVTDIVKRCGDFTLRSKFEASDKRFALLGSSGSGKSLTLKCIAGIEKPDEGIIKLGDRVLFDSEKKINLPPRERHVGYLFQDYALFPNMTAFENINIIARDEDRTNKYLSDFNILKVAKLKPSRMSGGECQRVALARMLASDPEIILLDEPFCALDNYMHTIIEREIMDILKDFDGPSVLVSHDRDEVYRMCDVIGVMDNGTLIDVNDRDSFFSAPSSVVAARLTGCKNISRFKDGFATDWGINIKLPEGADKERIKCVGYRAHYFERVDKAMKDEDNVFEAVIDRVIEDTFSSVICFRQKGNAVHSSDSVITWITDKESGKKIKEASDIGDLFLKIDPSKLILLER